MSLGLLGLHLLGFVLPALAMAVLMPWAGRWVMGTSAKPIRHRMWVHALSGVCVLLLPKVVGVKGRIIRGRVASSKGTANACVALLASPWFVFRVDAFLVLV